MAGSDPFERFQRRFGRDAPVSTGGAGAVAGDGTSIDRFLVRFGGASYAGGLYRTVSVSERAAWLERISSAFPTHGPGWTCFGYDWLGRAFALDPDRLEGGAAGVNMLEPGTGEVLEIPANLLSFHDQELVGYTDAALALDLFERWTAVGGAAPSRTPVVGYGTALFLGGGDELSNLELSDLDVYWRMTGQVIARTRA